MGALPPIPGDWLHEAVPRALSKQFQTNPFQREGERQAGSAPSLLKDGTDLPGIPVQQSLGGTQGASPAPPSCPPWLEGVPDQGTPSEGQ